LLRPKIINEKLTVFIATKTIVVAYNLGIKNELVRDHQDRMALIDIIE
jgi:hypothetical protein